MRNDLLHLALAGAFFTLLPASDAANFFWDNGSGDNNWATATNWTGDILPGSSDQALLYGNYSINITTAVPSANLNIRDGSVMTVLNILPGGNLTVATASYIAHNSATRGQVNIIGGNFQAKAFSIAGGVAGTNATRGELNISGGNVTWTSASLGTGGNGSLSVNGTWTGSISGTSLTTGPGAEMVFRAGSNGVQPVILSSSLTIDPNAKLTVDLSGYSGNATSIMLVNAANLSGTFQANKTTLLGNGNASLVQNTVTGDIAVSLLPVVDPIVEARQKVLALGNLTASPGIYEAFVGGNQTGDLPTATAASLAPGDEKKIFYDTLPYDRDGNATTERSATRSFAWIGIPASASAQNKVPAVVLVHGGGGTAYVEWVREWTARGYAAIAMSVEGHTDDKVSSIDDPAFGGDATVGSWKKHAMSGPQRSGIYGDTSKAIEDQWMYHATADTILANSLLGSLPFVDANKVGLMGVSWGGVIVSTVIGIDTRFAFGIPTYGCGHKFDIPNQYGGALAGNELYKKVWDPMVRMDRVTMPVLWLSWPNEMNFSLDAQAYSYLAAVNSKRVVTLIPGMLHGHAQAYDRPDTYDFAESVLSTGTPWIQQQSVSRNGTTATAVFQSTKPLTSATLIHTTGTGHTGTLAWTETPLANPVEGPAGTWTVTGTLPAGTTGWVINVRALGTPGPAGFEYTGGNSSAGAPVVTHLFATTDYQEIIAVDAAPSSGISINHPIGQAKSTGTTEVGFSGPTNAEIIDIRFENATHPAAFSHLMTLPWVLTNPLPNRSILTMQFDNSVAGLTALQTANATMVLKWEKLDGTTGQTSLPIQVTARPASNITYNGSANWSSQTTYSSDSVFVQSGATVVLDSDAQITNLTVGNGTLLMSQNRTLSTSGNLTISTGGNLTLTNGTLSPNVDAVTINGTLLIDGGVFSRSITGVDPDFNGNGRILLKSGTFALTGGGYRNSDYDVTTLQVTTEIHGGTFSIEGSGLQSLLGTLRVVGNDPSTSIKLSSSTASSSGNFSFVLGPTGVAPVDFSGFVNPANAALQVDGSAYTGGPATIPLIKTTNLTGVIAAGKISITGFAGKGLNASILQDQTTTEDVFLVLTAAPLITASPSTLGNFTATPEAPSAAKNLTVLGSALEADVTVSSTAGFEVSTNNSTFGPNATLARTGSSVNSTIFVRIASGGTAGSNATGNLSLASANATTITVSLAGRVQDAFELGYESGYQAGLAAVKSNPTSHGLFTQAERDAAREAGRSDVTSNPSSYNLHTPASILDMNLGGLVIQASGGNATVRLKLQKTTDLSQPFQDMDEVQFEMPIEGGKAFLRVRAVH